MAKIIQMRDEGIEAYPITKPECVIDENGKTLKDTMEGWMPATPSGDPMHYLYVTAGAEYNDTGADIETKDYYGNVVIHKAGKWLFDFVNYSNTGLCRALIERHQPLVVSSYVLVDELWKLNGKKNLKPFSGEDNTANFLGQSLLSKPILERLRRGYYSGKVVICKDADSQYPFDIGNFVAAKYYVYDFNLIEWEDGPIISLTRGCYGEPSSYRETIVISPSFDGSEEDGYWSPECNWTLNIYES